jgi:hypothetical protein
MRSWRTTPALDAPGFEQLLFSFRARRLEQVEKENKELLERLETQNSELLATRQVRHNKK